MRLVRFSFGIDSASNPVNEVMRKYHAPESATGAGFYQSGILHGTANPASLNSMVIIHHAVNEERPVIVTSPGHFAARKGPEKHQACIRVQHPPVETRGSQSFTQALFSVTRGCRGLFYSGPPGVTFPRQLFYGGKGSVFLHVLGILISR
jgi:hypothetical protein